MTARVLLVGKIGAIVHLHENVAAGFHDAGSLLHEFAVNGANWQQQLRLKSLRLLHKGLAKQALINQFARTVEQIRPDLVFFIFPFYYPPRELFDVALAAPTRPILAGWVGDRFDFDDIDVAKKLHRIYYSDSQFIEEARRWHFPDNACFLPLAADARRFQPRPQRRNARMIFVANITKHRESVVVSIRQPIVVWGRHWNKIQNTPHEIHSRRLPQNELPRIYASYRASLNIRNEDHVLSGINQRTFEPAACGTPVVNDAMPDLERCFEPGKEILVYHDTDELNAIYDRLSRDEAYASRIGEAAQHRVLTEHTYAHRIQFILNDLALDH